MSSAALAETRLSGRVFVLTLGGEDVRCAYGANCTVVLGREGVLVVDPLIAPAHAKLVEGAVATKTGRPIRDVVLTHHHTDHALGAGTLARQGTRVHAQHACARRMAAEHPGLVAERQANPALAPLFADAFAHEPGHRFEYGVTLDLGGVTALVIHTGHGHTPGDAIVYVPEESLAICGDLVSSGYHVNYEDADPSGLDRGLAALSSLSASRFVPGHGPAGGPEVVSAQARYHAAARQAAAAGGGADAVASRLVASFPSHRLAIVAPSAESLASR
jgi:glyoxylase-like metal-dependent hydrolase (beta-lactamase superfamily II)